MIPEWIRNITIDELPEAYREIARIIGVENAVLLSEHFGGLAFYFPKLDAIVNRKRDEAIRREFTGANHRDLARKYCLSEIWIRKIVQNGRDERQTSFL